jgi:hypothetical protein
MISAIMRRAAMIGALITAAAVLLTAAAAVGASAAPNWPQHRQLAVATLSSFKVVLTATRTSGQPPRATVTASGYRRSGGRWKLISTQRIGQASQWFWFSVATCSLTTTQFQGSSPTRRVAAIKVSLLATPSIGCSRAFSNYWRP